MKLPISFDEETHIYRDADNIRIPSVTQIISGAGLQDFSKVKKSDLDCACERGRKVHKMCEIECNGLSSSYLFPEELMGYLEGWRKFIKTIDATILSTERMIWNPIIGYAGRTDVLLQDKDFIPWLVDIKTSEQFDDAHELQLAAYFHALSLSAKDILPPEFEETVKCACVHLSKDGFYKIMSYNIKRGWPDFLAALQVYRWKIRAGKIKGELAIDFDDSL